MVLLSRKSGCLCLTALLLGGCCFPVREKADHAVADLAAHPVDVRPMLVVDTTPAEEAPPPKPTPASEAPVSSLVDPQVLPTSAQQPESVKKMADRIRVPKEVPGGTTPPIQLPADPDQRKAAIAALFPALPALGEDVQPVPGPDSAPLTLAGLQHLAVTNSPLIRQAAADVEAARGAALQAGAYPNPTVGPEFDTVGTGPGHIAPGYMGGFIDQVIKTGGKLQLARAAALMDLRNAEVALQRAQSDLISQVRAGYFAVLVAQENVKVSRALVRFTDEVYKIQVEQVTGAQAAPYEPMQIRVLVFQARAALVQARNRYLSAWKQLSAALGLPALPPTQLEGRADMPLPRYCYRETLAHVLREHTDVLTAENGILKGRYNLRLAQVMPVPDPDIKMVVQHDYTSGLGEIAWSAQVSIPLPIFDHNKGGIMQAQGQLLRAVEQQHQVRDDLTTRLADAFERYENNRVLVEYYRSRILPDQVRAYRAIYERHQQEPDRIEFNDVVTAQQTLATVITTYVTTLGALWTSVVDVANLLQTKDLFQTGPEMPETHGLTPLPDLDALPPLPCCHPLSPAPEPGLKGGDARWPPADPQAATDCGVKPRVLEQPKDATRAEGAGGARQPSQAPAEVDADATPPE
jgi:cobalt-zinc-cadmium efflux system outer membrane protein